MLLANLTPTVKAIATGGTFFAKGDDSTRRSSPLMIWYRVLDDTARKTPDQQMQNIRKNGTERLKTHHMNMLMEGHNYHVSPD